MGFTGFYWVLLGFTVFQWVLLGFTGFYWVLLGFTGFSWVLLGFTGFYWVLLGFTGFNWVSMGFTGFYWVSMGFNGFQWVLLGFTGFLRVWLGFTGKSNHKREKTMTIKKGNEMDCRKKNISLPLTKKKGMKKNLHKESRNAFQWLVKTIRRPLNWRQKTCDRVENTKKIKRKKTTTKKQNKNRTLHSRQTRFRLVSIEAFIVFPRVWLALTGFYWVLQGFMGFYWVLLSLTR